MIEAIRRFVSRCHALLRPGRADAELARELHAVRTLMEERHRQRGLTPAQAAAATDRELRAPSIRDAHRDARSFPWVEDAWRDLRFAVRTLARMPAFTGLAILTLALGIGAVTVIYSVIHNVLLAPLPYPHADRFVNVFVDSPSGARRGVLSAGEFHAFRTQTTVFEEVVGTSGEALLLTLPDRAELVRAVRVTPNFFAFMGIAPLLGRTPGPEDARPDAPAIAVLRHRAWVSFFGSDPGVIGRTFLLDGQPRTIVAVMPPRFTWHAADLWIPDPFVPNGAEDPTWVRNFQARLRPGATLAQAEAQITTIAAQRARERPRDYFDDFRMRVVYVIDDVIGSFREVLYSLLVAVGLLMLIACCNVANMLLARATVREREMTVRAALGAGRGRIVRQLLVESVLLSAAAALVGCGLAYVGLELIVPLLPAGPLPGEVEIVLNGPALIVSLILAIVSGLLFGIAPAFYSARTDLVDGLRGAGKGTSGGRGRVRNALVVAEIAIAVVLVLSAGLLMRSFLALADVKLGFDPERVLVARPAFPPATYTNAAERYAFYARWLARLRTLPGVERVAVTSIVPPYGGGRVPVAVAGADVGEDGMTSVQYCTDDYFSTIGIRLVRGRTFAEDGLAKPRPVAVVNGAFVRAYLAGKDPIGGQIRLTMTARPGEAPVPMPFEIVGEVTDVRNRGLREAPSPEIYLPGIAPGFAPAVVLRTSGEPARIVNAIRHELAVIDRRVALRHDSLEALLHASFYARPRFSLIVLSVFSGAGMLLVAIGVYSVMAYTVSRQTQEIAVRLALGARRMQVWRTVFRWAAALVASGLAVGLAASLVTGRLIADQLWNTAPHDLLTIAATIVTIVIVALVACLVPARRAMNVEPMIALRRD